MKKETSKTIKGDILGLNQLLTGMKYSGLQRASLDAYFIAKLKISEAAEEYIKSIQKLKEETKPELLNENTEENAILPEELKKVNADWKKLHEELVDTYLSEISTVETHVLTKAEVFDFLSGNKDVSTGTGEYLLSLLSKPDEEEYKA